MSDPAEQLAQAAREVVDAVNEAHKNEVTLFEPNTYQLQVALAAFDASASVRRGESVELDLLRDLEYSVRYGGDIDSVLGALDISRVTQGRTKEQDKQRVRSKRRPSAPQAAAQESDQRKENHDPT